MLIILGMEYVGQVLTQNIHNLADLSLVFLSFVDNLLQNCRQQRQCCRRFDYRFGCFRLVQGRNVRIRPASGSNSYKGMRGRGNQGSGSNEQGSLHWMNGCFAGRKREWPSDGLTLKALNQRIFIGAAGVAPESELQNLCDLKFYFLKQMKISVTAGRARTDGRGTRGDQHRILPNQTGKCPAFLLYSP